MSSRMQNVMYFVFIIIFFMNGIHCWKKKAKRLQSRETNPFNFIRLVVMRLIYGLASVMGFSEGMSNFMNGIFVPPGVEEDYGEYDDFDF